MENGKSAHNKLTTHVCTYIAPAPALAHAHAPFASFAPRLRLCRRLRPAISPLYLVLLAQKSSDVDCGCGTVLTHSSGGCTEPS